MAPRKGLSPQHYNRSKNNHLALSEIVALYQANVPVSIVKMTRDSAPAEHHSQGRALFYFGRGGGKNNLARRISTPMFCLNPPVAWKS